MVKMMLLLHSTRAISLLLLMHNSIFGESFAIGSDHAKMRNSALELIRFLHRWQDFEDYYYFDDYQPETEGEVPVEVNIQNTEEIYDLSNLSFEDKERLKSVGSIQEVAEITGLDLHLEPSEDYEMLTSSTGTKVTSKSLSADLRLRRQREGSSDDVPFAQRATCEPEKVSVKLPTEDGFRVVPSCVRIKKCGGCCNPGMVCVPTKVKKLSFKVLELALNNSMSRMKTMTDVTEEVACGCECGVKEEHCLDSQYYNEDACACFCKPELQPLRWECEAQGRHWDSYKCKCQCPPHGPYSDDDCGTGQSFNPQSCSCEYK